MRMSQGGIDTLLKPSESCKLKAYKCPADKWTIAYGHTSAAGQPQVTEGLVITQAEAEEILKRVAADLRDDITDRLRQQMEVAQ